LKNFCEVAMSEPFNYSVTEALRDGTRIRVRAIRPEDKPLLVEHFQSLSERSVYYRFFGHKRSLEQADLRALTELDFVNHVGLAATIETEGTERFIGVGRYLRSVDEVAAEVAFAVLDEFQGRGIGTVLLRHLAQIARRQGINKFAAFVMGDNHQMLEVFANSGFRTRDRYDAGTVRVTIDLAESSSDFSDKS
jgi:GNAT superfamily N-acetyltransferase